MNPGDNFFTKTIQILDQTEPSKSCEFTPVAKPFKIPKIKRNMTVEVTATVTTRPKISNNIPFGKLSMVDLKYIPIPKDIKEIEHNDDNQDDKSKLASHQNLYNTPTEANDYVEKFTKLIHFEEAANTKSLKDLNFRNATLQMVSEKEQTVSISSINDRNVKNWMQAFNSKKIDAIEFKPVGIHIDSSQCVPTGRIVNVEQSNILVKMNQGFQLLKSVYKMKRINEFTGLCVETDDKRFFDIEGITNRIPYLMQHSALNWIKKHNLFEILIENSKYNETADDNNKIR